MGCLLASPARRIARRQPGSGSLEIALERLSTGWNHPVDKKSLQIQKLEHILVAQIEWIRAEYALESITLMILAHE
jgi:hypothetical protein